MLPENGWDRGSDSLKISAMVLSIYYGHGLVATAYTTITSNTSSGCCLSYQLKCRHHILPVSQLSQLCCEICVPHASFSFTDQSTPMQDGPGSVSSSSTATSSSSLFAWP